MCQKYQNLEVWCLLTLTDPPIPLPAEHLLESIFYRSSYKHEHIKRREEICNIILSFT